MKKLIFKSYIAAIKIIEKIEKVTYTYNELHPKERIYDSQEYLNFKDKLNLYSIDPDRD